MPDGPEDALAGLWFKYYELNMARVAAVEEAALALLEGQLGEPLRLAAEREAHKLAGTVGTFGFATGSQLARDAELLLREGPQGAADGRRLAELVVALRRELEGGVRR